MFSMLWSVLSVSKRLVQYKFLPMVMMSSFDPRVYESMYNRPEEVPELQLEDNLTTAELLQQVKEQLAGKEKLLQRQFVNVSPQVDNQDELNEGTIFRVMTWNWLAQTLSSGKDNFVRCPVKALDWEFRRLRLLEEILRVDPDVLCLQEVDHYGFVAPILEKVGYKGSFFPKPDSPCLYTLNSNGPDGCAIFYRVEKFNMVSMEPIVLQTDSRQLETNQVSIMYKLQLKSFPDKEVVVATTHLKAKNGWHELRADQGKFLLKYLLKKAEGQPLIICGDFNAEPEEAVYEAYANSSKDFKSAYTLFSKSLDREPLYTTWKIRGGMLGSETDVCHTIDYMWYTKESIGVKALLSLPTEEEIGPDRLPSYKYPSDHLSLAADFIFL